MTQPTPREKYVFTFPQDENGKDVLYRFMLTLGRKVTEKVGDPSGGETIGSRLMEAIGTLDGVDNVIPGNRYTLEVTIARTFDAQEVIDELKRRLDKDVLSEIIVPKLVT